MPAPIRFWGRVLSLRPRLIVSKFEGTTEAHCPGYILTLDGTLTEGMRAPEGKVFTVAIGPATMQNREIQVGDLLRGDAYPVPDELPDTPAELYKVGVLRTIAPSEGAPSNDPPRTDVPLTPEHVAQAPRRALALDSLENACQDCSYGVIACVVRLSDPRSYRHGTWQRVPACLGPINCPHFRPREMG